MEYFESDTDDVSDSQEVSDGISVGADMISSDNDEARGGDIADGNDEDSDDDMSE